jgi:hypothetical protein
VIAEIFLALAGIVAVSTASVLVIARVLYNKVRRSRAISQSTLRARAALSVGRAHEVHALRVRLADTLSSGSDALALAGRTEGSVGELRRLYGRIREDGAAVDTQLVLLLSERDPAVLSQALPVAERRVQQVVGLIRELRAAVATGLGERTDDSLAALTDDLDREITALDAGLHELHTLNRRDPRPPTTGRIES